MSETPVTDASVESSAGGRKLLLRKLLLALFATLFTLLFLEVFARVYISKIADREHFTKYASLADYRERIGGEEWWFGLLAPHRYLGYVLAPNLVDGKNRHNSLSFRGDEIVLPKPKGEFRVVCIGASTTYSLLVPDYHRSYPALLESELKNRGYENVTVVNAGVPAWSTYEMLISYLLRVQAIEPDLVIVKEAFADLACRLVWPSSAFKGDNSGCLSPTFVARQTAFYESSALLRILLVESGHSLPVSSLGKSVYNQAETAYFFEFARQRFGLKYPSGIFTSVSVAQMLNANPPSHFRRNTEDLLLLAQARGVKRVLMTFPYSPEIPGYFGVEGFRSALDEHNGILRDIAAKLDVPLIDLARSFPTDKRYWGFDGIHANEEGTVLEAKQVADFLDRERLIPR
jgi:lysophospholipase L1-like esterase